MDESKELVPEAALSDSAYFSPHDQTPYLTSGEKDAKYEEIGWPIQFLRAPTVPAAAGQLDIGVGVYEETRSHMEFYSRSSIFLRCECPNSEDGTNRLSGWYIARARVIIGKGNP